MRIEGQWYAPHHSERHAAVLELEGDAYRLSLAGSERGVGLAKETGLAGADTRPDMSRGEVASLVFSERLGDTVRRVRFPDGALFETAENGAVDAWLTEAGHAGARSLGVHRLEGSWPMIGASLVLTIALGFGAFRWGVPAAAEHISDALPVGAHESVGRGALATMDRTLLEESALGADERAEIGRRFEALVAAVPNAEFEYELHFRRLGEVPNAFALPGGDIVVTDALVELARTPEELDSVLLHEVGHVHERHGMRHAIQASAVTLVVSLALGDVGGLGELATAVPVFLLQSGYSRESESEADEFAFARMIETGRDPKHFAAIIRRLGAVVTANDEGAGGEPRADWMSTHPDTERRARRALELSRELGG